MDQPATLAQAVSAWCAASPLSPGEQAEAMGVSAVLLAKIKQGHVPGLHRTHARIRALLGLTDDAYRQLLPEPGRVRRPPRPRMRITHLRQHLQGHHPESPADPTL
jgi:hypothetical protein